MIEAMFQEHKTTDRPASTRSASLPKHFATGRGRPLTGQMSAGSAGAGKQNAQLCATRSATQGGAIPRHNGGSARVIPDRHYHLQ
jgi:hypothetical protein